MNTFLAHHDDERRLAHRREHKQRLAELEVKRLTLSELQNIQRTLERDSETAADRHSEEAGKLQSELDRLDAEHVEAIMAGKSASQKSIQRRSEIMAELAKLNQILETTCEANRRAAIPIRKQIQELQIEIGKGQQVQNELIRLAHPNIRRERKLIELQLRACEQVSAEIRRRKDIAEENIRITSEVNREPHKAAVFHEQAADYDWMSQKNGELRASLLTRDRELHQQALAE